MRGNKERERKRERERIVPSWDIDGVRDIRYAGVLYLHVEFTDAWFLSRSPAGGSKLHNKSMENQGQAISISNLEKVTSLKPWFKHHILRDILYPKGIVMIKVIEIGY